MDHDADGKYSQHVANNLEAMKLLKTLQELYGKSVNRKTLYIRAVIR